MEVTPPPPHTFGDVRFDSQAPTQLVEETITLLRIVPAARRDDIRPLMAVTSRPRHHVINRVARTIAVRAAIVVSQEDGSARERWRPHARGESDHVMQSHNRRDIDRNRRRPAYRGILGNGDRFGATRQHQDHGTALAH